MESATKQTQVCEGIRAILAEVRSRTELSKPETPYWGVLCRTCQEVVAFDTSPYVSFGPAAASMAPGAIRCGKGHNHIYFPRDFQFCASTVPIADAVMRENRDQFRAINPTRERVSHDVAPEAPELAVSSGRDPRREAAQMAGRARWTTWAELKAR